MLVKPIPWLGHGNHPIEKDFVISLKRSWSSMNFASTNCCFHVVSADVEFRSSSTSTYSRYWIRTYDARLQKTFEVSWWFSNRLIVKECDTENMPSISFSTQSKTVLGTGRQKSQDPHFEVELLASLISGTLKMTLVPFPIACTFRNDTSVQTPKSQRRRIPHCNGLEIFRKGEEQEGHCPYRRQHHDHEFATDHRTARKAVRLDETVP